MKSNPEVAPIHEAAFYNQINEVRAFIKAGLSPNFRAKNGMNALHFALAHGNMACAKVLLKAGAKLGPRGKGAKEALITASAHGYLKPLKYLLANGVSPNCKNQRGWTPLHFAAMEQGHSYVSIVRTLLNFGANPKLKGLSGQTPLALLHEFMDGPSTLAEDLPFYKKKIRLLEKNLNAGRMRIRKKN